MADTPTKRLGAILGAISSNRLSDGFASRVDALSDLSLRPALHSSNASRARLHGKQPASTFHELPLLGNDKLSSSKADKRQGTQHGEMDRLFFAIN